MNHRLLTFAALAAGTLAGPAASHAELPVDFVWERLTPANTGIPGNDVRFAKFGPDGRLWVAARWTFFEDGALAVYDFDTDVWTAFAKSETPIPSEFLFDAEWAPDGSLWLATGAGLVRFDESAEEWTVYSAANTPMTHSAVQEIEFAPDGALWVVNTNGNGPGDAVWRFDGQTWEDHRVGAGIPWPTPWTDLDGLAIDGSGRVYVGNETQNGLAIYDGVGWTIHGGSIDRFRGIEVDNDGNVWARGGYTGFHRRFYKFDGGGFEIFSSDNTPLGFTTVTDIEVDEVTGDVLVSNWNGEVIRSSNGGDSWTETHAIGTRIGSIALRPGGEEVWLTSPASVRQHEMGGSEIARFNTFNTGLPDWFMGDIQTDRNGELWFTCGEGGASKFDGQRFRNWGAHNNDLEVYPFNFGTQWGSEPVSTVVQDQDGVYWMGSNGIARSTNLRDWETWAWANSNLGAEQYEHIVIGPDGTAWSGATSGVRRLENGSWTAVDIPGLPHVGEVEGMEFDDQGNLWIVARLFVLRFDGENWRSWTSSNSNLPVNNTSLAISPDGRVHVGTYGGLAVLSGETWDILNSGNTPMAVDLVSDIAFRGSDGLLAVSQSNVTVVAPDGTLGWGGFSLFDGKSWATYTTANSPLAHKQVEIVHFDAEGNLWIGPTSTGVQKLLIGAGANPADLDGDGVVSASDLAALISVWGQTGVPGDFSGDGVGADDLAALIAAWGAA